MGSYRLVIRRRLGFARLASEAGAALVPVLGVGEPQVAGEGGPGAVALRWLICYRYLGCLGDASGAWGRLHQSTAAVCGRCPSRSINPAGPPPAKPGRPSERARGQPFARGTPNQPPPAPRRPRELRVVFGPPVAPLPGESPAGLHARYLSALAALAKRHGVPIEIAE